MFKQELNNLKFENSIELYYLLDDEIFLKAFLVQLFKTAKKIENETNSEFHLIIGKMNKTNTNEYLLTDYRLLFIAFLELLENVGINKKTYDNAKTLFRCNEDKEKYDTARNLLFYLAKKEIVYFKGIHNFYYYCKYVRNEKTTKYVITLKSIALNYRTIKEIFAEDSKFLIECENIITRKYNAYKKRKNSKKDINNFNIQISNLSEKIYSNA